jgi:hypothetical protein
MDGGGVLLELGLDRRVIQLNPRSEFLCLCEPAILNANSGDK